MRVLMLLGRSTGGIGTHVQELSASLRSQGVEVAIVTDQLTAERFGLTEAHRWWPSRRRPVAAVRRLGQLRRHVRGADVVHAHGHQAGALAVLVTRGLRRRPAVVVSRHNAVLHGDGLHAWLLEWLQRRVARSADLVTGASADLVRAAADHGAGWVELAEVPSPRVPELLAAPLVDRADRRAAAADLLRSRGLPPDPPLVVTVSRIAPQKDLQVVLDAAGLIGRPVSWCVLGDGDPVLAERLRGQARQRRLPVHFLGAVQDPTPWLRAAEVFVLTSRWEARALVVQEALAAGVPVVCTDVGGLPELVAGVGTLVPSGSAAAVAAAVDHLLADDVVADAARAAGQARAGTWADRDASARRWVGWYVRAVAMTYS